MLVIGHRANSWRIAELYRRLGVEAVEVDVSIGPSGAPIVLHGPSEVKRPSPLGRLIAAIDYKFFYRDPVVKPRGLGEWLSRLQWARTVMLDIKSGISLTILEQAVEESGYRGRLIVSGHDHQLVLEAAGRIGGLAYPSFATRIIGLEDYVLKHEFDGVSIKYTMVNRGMTSRLQENGVSVVAWTVNDRSVASRLSCMGVDGVISDAPWVLGGVECQEHS